jgi:rod shape-determining protein MreB
VRAVVGLAGDAFLQRRHLREAFAALAEGVMMVSLPCAIAYGLEALAHCLVIDIGAESADFCMMQGHYPAEHDQKSLPCAGDAIDERLTQLIREHHPDAQFSVQMAREWKERYGFVGEAKNPVIVTVPVGGKAADIDITEEMRSACESILPPLGATLNGLLWDVEPGDRDQMRNNVILAGGISLVSGLPSAFAGALKDIGGGRATPVIDPVFAGSDGSLAIARDASPADWDQLSM